MLLYKIPGATSFIELKTHKDQVYHLYRATARAMGPLSDGNEWSATLTEASTTMPPHNLH